MTKNVFLQTRDERLKGSFSLYFRELKARLLSTETVDNLIGMAQSMQFDLVVIDARDRDDLPDLMARLQSSTPAVWTLFIFDSKEVEAEWNPQKLGYDASLVLPASPRDTLVKLQSLLEQRPKAINGESTDEVEHLPEDAVVPGAGLRVSGQVLREQCDARHLTVSSSPMKFFFEQLLRALEEPLGFVIHGESGSEFELVAREFQSLCSSRDDFLRVLDAGEISEENLATVCSLERLRPGSERILYVPNLERLNKRQRIDLIDYIREARRTSHNSKILRLICSIHDIKNPPGDLTEFLEELRFVLPMTLRVPPLRERNDDISLLTCRTLNKLTSLFPSYRPRHISKSALDWLKTQPWPGNFGEFTALFCAIIMECPYRTIEVEHLEHAYYREQNGTDPDEIAASRLLRHLERTGSVEA